MFVFCIMYNMYNNILYNYKEDFARSFPKSMHFNYHILIFFIFKDSFFLIALSLVLSHLQKYSFLCSYCCMVLHCVLEHVQVICKNSIKIIIIIFNSFFSFVILPLLETQKLHFVFQSCQWAIVINESMPQK